MTDRIVFFLPSPSTNAVHLGPLTLHMYGLMLLLGIAACTWLTVKRWVASGGQPELVYRVALWGVLFGIVGARLYHVITSWSVIPGPKWQGIFEVWNGGLGIWGGVLFGCLAGALVVRRADANVSWMLDAAAPGILLAQGIGRWGNWWNQELFGKPSTLPWALKISPSHRPPGYLHNATFHPTFLYESLWDILFVAVLLWIDRRFTLRRPALFALYVSFYTAFRTYEETLRIDLGSHYYAGFRLNFYVSLTLFALSAAFFFWWQFLRPQRVSPAKLPEHA
jgi:prolipoprotein diacylglyceryl transferase